MISTNQLKNGNHIEVDGTVLGEEFQHVKPGKGGAFVRTKLRRASDGNVIDKTFRAGEKFRAVCTEARKITSSTPTAPTRTSWTPSPTSRWPCPSRRSPRRCAGPSPTRSVDVLFIDGQPSDLQLPASVVLAVSQTEPGPARRHRVGRRDQPATLETGATINVPLFVDVGDDPAPIFPKAGRARTRRRSSARASKLAPLEWYCRLANSAKSAVFLTAAFGLTPEIAPVFEGKPYLRYLLLDLETGNVETVRRDP